MSETNPAPATPDLGDLEASRLKQQVQVGDFSEMRGYLTKTRNGRDWQDRCFLLTLVAQHIQIDALLAARAAEPEAADLVLLLGVYYFDQLAQSRGTRPAEQTSEEQFISADQQLNRMMNCLLETYTLDPGDPTPHVFAVRGLVVFSENESLLKQEYAEAIRLAPDCVPAHFTMVNARSKKWGGSHQEALQIARTAMKAGEPGSDIAVCLFLAHFSVWQYARIFDKNKAESDRYLKDRSVSQELNQALDLWIGENYLPRRSSIPYLHQAALCIIFPATTFVSSDFSRSLETYPMIRSGSRSALHTKPMAMPCKKRRQRVRKRAASWNGLSGDQGATGKEVTDDTYHRQLRLIHL